MATLHTKERCSVCALWKDKLRECFHCARQVAAPASARSITSASKRRVQELEAAFDAALEQSDALLDGRQGRPRPRSSRSLTSFAESSSRALGSALHPHEDEYDAARI